MAETCTWEKVIQEWNGSYVSFLNVVRDIQGRGQDNRLALFRVENGVEIKVTQETLDKVRENNTALASMGAALSTLLIDSTTGQPKLDDVLSRLGMIGDAINNITAAVGRIETKVDALGAS